MDDAKTLGSAAHLFDILSQFSLTRGQSEAIFHLGEYLDGNAHDIFLLRGHAGTGKTFLIDALIKMLSAQRRTAALSAPTGRAARVITEKTGEGASTIHSLIYDFDKIEERKTAGVDGSETYKLIVSLTVNDSPADTVFITDEASLISDQYSEAEFFQCGSGHVLRDLMHYINFDINSHRKKLILIGDDAQLPPVGMSFSPALSDEYLCKNFGVRVTGYELEDVVRQKSNSGILKNVEPLRQCLKSGVFSKLVFDTDLPDVSQVDIEDVVSTYLDACDHKVSNAAVVITYSNADAGAFNRSIRERLFPGQPEASPGDKLMVVKNTKVQGIRIANGDFVLVKAISAERKIRAITLRRKNETTGQVESIPVELSFREAELGLRLIDASVAYVTTNIIENLLYEDRRELSSDEHKALYVDFCQRHPHLRKDPEAFSQALLGDPYFNALRVKFGYALTCHKAQGSEWDTAIVSCASNSNPLSADTFRWLYTALTRAKSRLYLINPPKIEVGGGIRPASATTSLLSASAAQTRQTTPASARQLLAPDICGQMAEDTPPTAPADHREVILHRVKERLAGMEVEIEGVDHNQYQEAFFFRRGEDQARINISYNGRLSITRVIAPQDSAFSSELVSVLLGMVGESCAPLGLAAFTPATACAFQSPQFGLPFLEEFHDKLLCRMEAHGIAVVGLDQKQWFQRYSFKRGGEQVAVDIYYNAKHVFTKCQPTRHTPVPPALLSDVIEILTGGMNG